MGITSSVYLPPKSLFSTLASHKKQKFVVQIDSSPLMVKSKHIGDVPYSLTPKTLVDGEDLVSLLEQNLDKFSNELKKLVDNEHVREYICAASDSGEDDVGESRYGHRAQISSNLRDSMSNTSVAEYVKVLGNEKATEVLLRKVKQYVAKATVDSKPPFDSPEVA